MSQLASVFTNFTYVRPVHLTCWVSRTLEHITVILDFFRLSLQHLDIREPGWGVTMNLKFIQGNFLSHQPRKDEDATNIVLKDLNYLSLHGIKQRSLATWLLRGGPVDRISTLTLKLTILKTGRKPHMNNVATLCLQGCRSLGHLLLYIESSGWD
jgi:hypothetical protein